MGSPTLAFCYEHPAEMAVAFDRLFWYNIPRSSGQGEFAVKKLSDEEVLYILDTQLPAMLEREPELEPRAFHAFMKAFATKESVAAILEELRAFDGRVLHFQAETIENQESVQHAIQELRAQIARRFEQVDRRFEQVDQRLEQVQGEIQGLRTDMLQRFEQVDQRFEQVDQRFEQVDQRFEQVDQRFEQLDRKVDDLKDWVEMVVGGFQVRSGRKLEDVVAGALRLVLKRPDITPDRIRLRQKVVDEKGSIGPIGRNYEVDILADDGRITLFEVKSVCEVEDVDRLADKVALMRTLHPDRQVDGVMVTLGVKEEEVKTRCAHYGIPLVH